MIQATILKKKVKNITIKVKSNCEVILTAPLHIEGSHINNILSKKDSWIKEKIAFFKKHSQHIPSQKYISGENIKFLGRDYRLKVFPSLKETVELKNGYINIFTYEKNDFQKKETLINAWYLFHLKKEINKTINKYESIINRKVNKVSIKKMRTRWGSCNPTKAYINLNSALVKVPIQCIEYVVLHELSHLLYPNHSKKFHDYLCIHMPNWKTIKEQLNKYSI